MLYRDTSSCKGWLILLACIVASQHTAPSQTGRRAARLSTAAHRPLARWPSTGQRRSAAVGPRHVELHTTTTPHFDRNELRTWGWCHSVRLVKAHRLTCNMTYLGHTVTLTRRDPRSKFKIDLSRIANTWVDPAWREEHDSLKIIPLA